KPSKWILSKWRTLKSNTEGSSDNHHENVGPVIEAVKNRRWAIPDDESDNWSNAVVEFYQNGDSTYCYSAVFFKNEKLDKQFWGTLLGYGCNGNLSSNHVKGWVGRLIKWRSREVQKNSSLNAGACNIQADACFKQADACKVQAGACDTFSEKKRLGRP
ncbi:hypothetical protein R6Q59_002062, partial [Mikania micrantha]